MMKNFLKTVYFFRELTDEQLDEVLSYCQEKAYKTGDLIISEGERGDSLYIIKKGRAEVLKGELATGEVEHLGSIKASEWAGEMAFLEEDVSTASVKAIEPTHVVIFSIKKFIASSKHADVAPLIMETLAKKLSLRLRKTNESIIVTLKEKLNMTRILVSLYILFAVYLVVFKYIAKYAPTSPMSSIFSSILIVAIAIAVFYVIYRAKLPLETYGVTTKNWLRNARDGFLLSIPVLIFCIFLKWIAIRILPLASEMPLFQISTQGINFIFLYIALIPLQEFGVRGLLQTAFKAYFRGSNKVLYAILTSNLIFEMFHNIKTISLSILVFFLGIFWGFLFEQQKSLIGPIVSHIVVGGVGFFLLNVESIPLF